MTAEAPPSAAAPSLAQAIAKGKLFGDRVACTHFIQDLALSRGKRAVVDKKKSGGKNIVFRCSSATPCSFQVNVRKKT